MAARADFEILSREVYGKPLVYLDNARLGAEAAAGAGRDARFRDAANTPMSIAACIISRPRRPNATRPRARRVRRFLNAAHADEIVFTKGGTEAINLVSYSYPRAAHPAGR